MNTRAIHSSVPDVESEQGVKEYGLHERILEILPVGRENAITSDAIATIVQVPRTRTNQKIRKACNELREIMDKNVFSTLEKPRGFYIARYKEDVKPYIDTEQNRIDAIQKSIDTAEEVMDRLPSKSGFLFPGCE